MSHVSRTRILRSGRTVIKSKVSGTTLPRDTKVTAPVGIASKKHVCLVVCTLQYWQPCVMADISRDSYCAQRLADKVTLLIAMYQFSPEQKYHTVMEREHE